MVGKDEGDCGLLVVDLGVVGVYGLLNRGMS